MNILTIVHIVSYVIALIILIALPIRIGTFSKKNGECLLVLKRTTGFMYPLIIGLSFVMLVGLYFREYALYMVIILHIVPLLALEMSSKELVYRNKAGIYADFIIVGGRKLFKNEFYALPTLEYETDINNTLEVVTEKKGTVLLVFANTEERIAAVKILKDWRRK